jgi:hypothetical protein
LLARLDADDFGWHFNFTGSGLDRVFAQLSKTAAAGDVSSKGAEIGKGPVSARQHP